MANIISSPIPPGKEILADDFNRLWRDLMQNHNHDAVNQIDHADLLETGPMSGFTYDHGDVDTHIAAVQGIHGLKSTAYPVGGYAADYHISYGIADFDTTAQLGGTGPTYSYKNVTFPGGLTYDGIPAVFLTMQEDPYDDDPPAGRNMIWARAIDTTSFRACFMYTDWYPPTDPAHRTFAWLALGVLA